jgi:tRNA A-37 threonylcarbamoyl transferase component Bud32
MRKIILNEKNVGKEINHGTESKVFLYTTKDGRRLALKRYRDYLSDYTIDTKQRKKKEEKLEFLSSIDDPDIVKIHDLVFKNGKLIGYTMDLLDGTEIKFSNTLKDRLKHLRSVRETVLRLNKQGIYVGDFRPSNFIWTPDGRTISIDIDNFKVSSELDFDLIPVCVNKYENSECDSRYIDSFCFNIYAVSMIDKYFPSEDELRDIKLPKCLKEESIKKYNEEAIRETISLNPSTYTGKILKFPNNKKED